MSSADETPLLKDGWFTERNPQWPGVALSLQVEEVLWDQKSEYQHVQVFRSATFGHVLVLDGVLQYTEKDEMAYQEMITHLPLAGHAAPADGAEVLDVLIVGGGDGGVLREVLRHKCVRSVTMCEIDQMVMDVAQKFLGNAAAFKDPRAKIHRGDASVYVKEHPNSFDVIISDTSDPVGPAEALFGEVFYRDVHAALRPGGRCAFQAESVWLHLPLITRLCETARKVFAWHGYASTQIPTYPGGQIGILVCSKAGGAGGDRADEPLLELPADQQAAVRFYSKEMHRAAYVLPAFVAKAISPQ